MSVKTINDLLNKDGIVIPIIQRDYVQGNDLESERRNEFLDSLFKTLLIDSEKQNLDFIYGRSQKGLGFLPLDGQQRLTTLYLLSWFIHQVNGSFSNHKDKMQKFSYKTRNSSERFCTLISNLPKDFIIDFEQEKISKQISNLADYDVSWNDDPTIKSMLQMLDAINIKYKQLRDKDFLSTLLGDKYDTSESFEQLSSRLEQRINSDAICFDLLDMNDDNFKLTDELYIKMNARGKQLTDFENFKARFIDFIESEHTSLKDEFCEKIEYNWTQLFWPYAYIRWEDEIKQQVSEEAKDSCKYPIIDDYFMNFLKVISQLLYFRDNTDKKATDFVFDFEQIKSIYSTPYNNDKDWNLKFLFSSLDFFYHLSYDNKLNKPEKITAFFNTYYTTKYSSSSKINIFIDSFNLFEQALYKGTGMDEKGKMYLYCICFFNFQNKSTNWETYLRFIRNMLESKKQKDYSKHLTHLSSLIRLTDFGKYCPLFEAAAKETDLEKALIENKITSNTEKEAFSLEVTKASLIKTDEEKKAIYSLENNLYLKGDLGNFEIRTSFNNITNYSKTFIEIWNFTNQILINQAIIATGFNGLRNKKCKLGETIFYGTSESWDRILTEVDASQPNWLINFLDQYIQRSEKTIEAKLKGIISNAFSKLSNNNLLFYLLKYSDFFSELCYFAKKNDFEIRILKSDFSNPLVAYHINPYVLTVCNKINNPNIVDARDCHSIQSEISGLCLKNGISMECKLDGWLINDSNGIIPDTLIKKYKINNLLLKHTIQKDRIEIAVDFCNEMYQLIPDTFVN